MSSSIKRLVTGNEYVSIPDISVSNGGIECIGFVHHAFRASVELHGSEDMPLLKPTVQVDGEEIFEEQTRHDLISYWIPSFEASSPRISTTAMVFAPLERRGFACVLTIQNTSDAEIKVTAGWKGCWKSSYHAANISKLMPGMKYANISSWRPGVPIIEFRGHTPLFAMALVSEDSVPARITEPSSNSEIKEWTGESISATAGTPVYYELVDEYVLKPNETRHVPIYLGIGLEEVSAIASAQELSTQGWNRMFTSLKTWLEKHVIDCDDKYFKRLMNVNSFYNYFFSQAIAIDTENLVLTSSRCSRHDACASYRDRDALRWSLPAVLQISWSQARDMLIYAFTTQLSNIGINSRFIDGIVLEPGFQLDQLCAPVRALDIYVETTGDMSIVFDRRVQMGVNTIQRILAAQRHPEVALFETLLHPSGTPSLYPYVCFSNMLVWRILLDIGRMYNRIRDIDRAEEANALATKIKDAIFKHFVVEGPFGPMFARGIDLQGNHELGDDPAGSLQLLAYFGFVMQNDTIYLNTMKWIHSEHNPLSCCNNKFQASMNGERLGLSVLSLVNDLLTERTADAMEFLKRADIDDGIACATADFETGKATSGMAFASCAGYLAFGLRTALKAISPQTDIVEQKRRPSETLYHPPPETRHDTKKARM